MSDTEDTETLAAELSRFRKSGVGLSPVGAKTAATAVLASSWLLARDERIRADEREKLAAEVVERRIVKQWQSVAAYTGGQGLRAALELIAWDSRPSDLDLNRIVTVVESNALARFAAMEELCRDNAHASGSGEIATLWMSFANSISRALDVTRAAPRPERRRPSG